MESTNRFLARGTLRIGGTVLLLEDNEWIRKKSLKKVAGLVKLTVGPAVAA